MKGGGIQALGLKKLGHAVCFLARGAIDNGPGPPVGGQEFLDRGQDMRQLLGLGRGTDRKGKVRARCPAIQRQQIDTKARSEMFDDVGHHLGLGGCGQARDRRGRLITGELANETPEIAVIGSEIMAPFRDAMRLVHNPEPDLPLGQNRTDRSAA